MRGFGRGYVRRLGPAEAAAHGAQVDPRDRVPLVYRLVPDAKGWPPVEAEKLWAAPLGFESYRIDNIPFFVQNLAQGDIVRAVPVGGYLLPLSRRSAGNRTIRIRPHPYGPLAGDPTEVFDRFIPLGVEGERSEPYNLVALNVPADVPASPVRTLLWDGAREGLWDYEEACIDDAWYLD